MPLFWILCCPGMDGLTFCRELRGKGERQTPVLMLTARDTLADKLKGFDAGADDYLVKPFAMQELDARLVALVRRSDNVQKNPDGLLPTWNWTPEKWKSNAQVRPSN